MNEIYDILSKHFSRKANPEEEKQARSFQKENPKEYLLLSKLWKSEGIIVKDYDENKAWNELQPQLRPTKVIPLYQKLARVAAVLFFLIVASFLLYQTSIQQPASLLVFQTSNTESNKQIALADGSVVYLNKGSKLFYPAKFDDESREVKLEGEAFFEVAHDKTKPFIITTNHNEVEVLGTSFNIETRADQTEVVVATGLVKVQSLFNEEQSSILSKNQSALTTANKLTTSSENNNNYMAWKTGAFSFKEQPIKKVVQELNTYYNNQLKLSNPNTSCNLTASFAKDDLQNVLEVIQLSCDLKATKKNEKYELY